MVCCWGQFIFNISAELAFCGVGFWQLCGFSWCVVSEYFYVFVCRLERERGRVNVVEVRLYLG